MFNNALVKNALDAFINRNDMGKYSLSIIKKKKEKKFYKFCIN